MRIKNSKVCFELKAVCCVTNFQRMYVYLYKISSEQFNFLRVLCICFFSLTDVTDHVTFHRMLAATRLVNNVIRMDVFCMILKPVILLSTLRTCVDTLL